MKTTLPKGEVATGQSTAELRKSAETPELVRAFYQYMTGAFGASVIDKRNAKEMQVVAGVLGALGIVNREDFLRRFATTIGRRIYLPFDIGDATQGWSLWSQICVLTHECQHIVQYDAAGPFGFAWRYITNTAARAAFEAEAYRCQLELKWWRTRTLLSPVELAASLRNYGVSEADVQVAQKTLEMSAETVKRGGVINQATKVAIAWLEANAPELRATGG